MFRGGSMLKELLKVSTHTVILTGAGMSTESGLPDFRSALKGVWNNQSPQELASIHAITHNREAFVEFYKTRIEGLTQFHPHKGHNILAKWEKLGLIQYVITQNVDGFHQEAGSENVADLHGTLRQLHCHNCKKSYPNMRYINGEYDCECGGFLRPSVVLFGEALPDEATEVAQSEADRADLFVVLGSSLQVTPANLLPIKAKQKGAKLVIVNMESTELDEIADVIIHHKKIGDVLEELDRE